MIVTGVSGDRELISAIHSRLDLHIPSIWASKEARHSSSIAYPRVYFNRQRFSYVTANRTVRSRAVVAGSFNRGGDRSNSLFLTWQYLTPFGSRLPLFLLSPALVVSTRNSTLESFRPPIRSTAGIGGQLQCDPDCGFCLDPKK